MKSDFVYLEHILEAIKLVEKYTKGFDVQSFQKNSLVQDGVIRQLGVIGEAAKHLSSEQKKTLNSIEWVSIVGMRNKLIHEYFGVDLEAVWLVVQNDLPVLKKAVKSAL